MFINHIGIDEHPEQAVDNLLQDYGDKAVTVVVLERE